MTRWQLAVRWGHHRIYRSNQDTLSVKEGAVSHHAKTRGINQDCPKWGFMVTPVFVDIQPAYYTAEISSNFLLGDACMSQSCRFESLFLTVQFLESRLACLRLSPRSARFLL